MTTKNSVRTEGAVLVGRKDGAYVFIDSVFRHDAELFGCTGTEVYPVSAAYADELLSFDQMGDRYTDYWADRTKDSVKEDCVVCDGEPDEDGCEYCDYQSLEEFCREIAQYDGIDSMIDFPGWAYVEALNETGDLDDEAEYADCVGCGRIFGGSHHPGLDGYDEVYNRKALVACLAYEDGAVSYDYARRVIFGE